MPSYETVSIGGTKKLSEIMKLKTPTTTQMAPALAGNSAIQTKPKSFSKIPKKMKNNGLLKEQLDLSLQQANPMKKYSSKDNKLNIKEEKIMQVLNYQNSARFGNDVRKTLKFNYTRDQLVKKTIDQIDNILFRIRNYLNNRGMNGIYEQMVRTTATGYENLITNFGYDITGFGDMLFANPAFWDSFERWKIEKTLPDVPPSFQLMYIISATTMLAHMKNKQLSEPVRKKPEKKDDKNEDDKVEKTPLKVGATL